MYGLSLSFHQSDTDCMFFLHSVNVRLIVENHLIFIVPLARSGVARSFVRKVAQFGARRSAFA